MESPDTNKKAGFQFRAFKLLQCVSAEQDVIFAVSQQNSGLPLVCLVILPVTRLPGDRRYFSASQIEVKNGAEIFRDFC